MTSPPTPLPAPPIPTEEGRLKLLFITQKLHGQDAFGMLWIKAFQARGYDVQVLCLEWRPEEAKAALGVTEIPFSVVSLGKENGTSRFAQILQFMKLSFNLPYDRVFIHMTPVWGVFGAPAFILRKKPVYLWYTHYKMQLGLRLIGWYGKRIFCATRQSVPQYEGSPKKIVVGHGIDLSYWPMRPNVAESPHKLLVVHRLSRSKRVEILLQTLTLLPDAYTLDIYGIEAEEPYVAMLRKLVTELHLEKRVAFKGTIATKDLPSIYTHHRLILNMASETIDKTMLEAMTCGCYPITTKGNAHAIGIPVAPDADTPATIAPLLLEYAHKMPLTGQEMYTIVEEHHSLTSLIAKMDTYINPGT